MAVYGVLQDKKNRYDHLVIKKAAERMMRKAGFAVAERGDGLAAALSETALSASGVIDVAAVKEAGKIAGVDVFFFIYPALSGLFSERVRVSVKGVNVSTGAVVFARDYEYDERPIIGLELAVAYPVVTGYHVTGTLSGRPTGGATWAPWNEELNSAAQSITPGVNLHLGINIPRTDVSIRFGIGGNSPDIASGIITNHPVGSNSGNMGFGVQGMKGKDGFTFDLCLPVSKIFGDIRDTLRFFIGGQLQTFDLNSQDGNQLVANFSGYTGAPPLTSRQLPLNTWAVRTGLETRIAGGFCLVVCCTVALPWTLVPEAPTTSGPLAGLLVTFNSPLAAELALGLLFRVF